jgi:UDP:flavonoid glycosyltransferase YjiC (YdhE family)
MNITILTYGSLGDVQPFLPLSRGLTAVGHSVKLAAPARFMELVEGYGIRFVPLAGDSEDLSRRLNHVRFNFVRMVHEMMNHAIEIGADVLRQTEEACADADLIIHTFLHTVGAYTLAREKNIPDIHVQTFPMFSPTGDYPNVTMPDLRLRALNRLTHTISKKITWWTSSFGFEQIRRRAGFPKRKLYFPFDWLLPHCKMAIHHGGAGTTSAGLRAGIPGIIVPFTADQPFWGRRVNFIGAGPRPIYVNNLSVENLISAIMSADDEALRKRAQVLGQSIRGEDGVQHAIRIITSHVSGF